MFFAKSSQKCYTLCYDVSYAYVLNKITLDLLLILLVI